MRPERDSRASGHRRSFISLSGKTSSSSSSSSSNVCEMREKELEMTVVGLRARGRDWGDRGHPLRACCVCSVSLAGWRRGSQCNDHDAGEHCSHTDHSAWPRDGRTIAVAVAAQPRRLSGGDVRQAIVQGPLRAASGEGADNTPDGCHRDDCPPEGVEDGTKASVVLFSGTAGGEKTGKHTSAVGRNVDTSECAFCRTS
eukprot:172128-Prymnesium_polylepis.1